MTGKDLILREYRKALREVTKRIAKLEREGYIIPESYKPKEKTRDKITRKEIQRLKKYKESYLKKARGVKYRTRTGRIVKGEKGEEMQRSEAAKKGWRERREREKEKIKLGDAMVNSIMNEVDEGIRQIPYIRSYERKDGYTRRCYLIREALLTRLEDDPAKLFLTLGKFNNSTVVERAQLACRYDKQASESEAWNACIMLLSIINSKVYTSEELKEFGELDAEDLFETFYD